MRRVRGGACAAWIGGLLAVAGLGTGTLGVKEARAQVQNAQVQGVVTAQETKKGLAGVTITVTGPALPDLQAEVSDASGRFVINELPPGDDYVVSFYYGGSEKPVVVRSQLRLSSGKSVNVNAAIQTETQKREVQVIVEKAPNVDTAGARTGVEINQETLRHTPLRGRTFESALALAPGSSNVAPRNFNGGNGSVATPGSDVGVSISGSTGSENAYLIDGINTTDPSNGVVGSQVHQYFFKEINVLTGGYQAEYGRATGGVISLVTKSGSNELHGGVYGSWVPYQLGAQTVARLGEAIGTRTKPDQNTWDLGFDLGGAIIKDRIWFYGGFVVTSVTAATERVGRSQIFDAATGGGQLLGSFECPKYLANSFYCAGARTTARQTQEIDYRQEITQSRRIYNAIAKLQFHLSQDHDITLSYIASPNTVDSYTEIGSVNLGSKQFQEANQVHDLSLRYLGKTFGKRLQIELMYAMHYQSQSQRPVQRDQEQYNITADPNNPYSLADFESVSPCVRQNVTVGGTAGLFNPCPVTKYGIGFGFYREQKLQRHQALAAFTLFVHALGVHAFKAGFDFQFLRNDATLTYTGRPVTPQDSTSGRGFWNTTDDGTGINFGLGFGALDSEGNPLVLDAYKAVTDTRNYAVYLRDSWSVGGPLRGLVINAGVRWDGQQMLDTTGKVRLDLLESFAPRVGLVYDFTQFTKRPGRGKLFVNYGRFFESIPGDVGERAFGGQGLAVRAPGGNCATIQRQPFPNTRPVPVISPECQVQTLFVAGGNQYTTLTGTKAPTVDEVVAGVQYEVGWDIVLGASYIYRNLANVIEDLSVDGAHYFLGNPGAYDPKVQQQLTDDAARLQAAAEQPGADATTIQAAADAQLQRDTYKAYSLFPKAERTYHAAVLTASKRLSNRFSLLASYTYSRTLGNYPGPYNGNTGQFNPHTSTAFDYANLLANRNGPLPTDRPHNIILTGFYQQPIRQSGILTAGLTFTAISGRPIEVLGAHAFAGQGEVSILPRGSGGRTPMVTQFDLHVGYDHKIGTTEQLGLYLDIVNLFNQREVLNVDDIYTTTQVDAITAGQASDLAHLKGPDGTSVVYNSNYGQPTAFQAPLYLRLGARLTF